jgi:hypothetical protein
VYVDEVAELVKRLTGADKVIAFGPTLRNTHPTPNSDYQPPGIDVHVDYTTTRSHILARNLLANTKEFKYSGEPDPEFTYSRFLCINLWRAISPGSQDWPLAVCHSKSVQPDEGTPNVMVVCDTLPDMNNLGPLNDEEGLLAAFIFEYREGHRWYYFSDMTETELLAFKLFDSSDPQGRSPHAAFFDKMEGTVPRESVEIRSVAYFK